MEPQDHWKSLPPLGRRAPLLVWVCALVWSALSAHIVLGNLTYYCLAHDIGWGFLGIITPEQALRLLPGFLLSAPGTLALLASIAAALLGALVYTLRR